MTGLMMFMDDVFVIKGVTIFCGRVLHVRPLRILKIKQT